MADYIEPPIVTDAEDLAAQVYDYIEANYPGWVANPTAFATIVTEAFASITSDVADVARSQANEQFRAFGTTVAGVPADEDANATIASTWTMIDNTGYTIPAGTQVGIPGPSGIVPFVVVDDVAVAPGDTVTDAGEVTLEAVEPGSDLNGLSGAPSLIDTLAYVSGISLVDVTSGGVTAETNAEYLDRLAREYRLMSPRPILPDDFAMLLINRVDGVARARAIDGYNPTGPLTDQERTVSVVGIDEAGQPLDGGTVALAEALLEAMREVNFNVFVIDPTYVDVEVAATVRALPGFEQGDVETAAETALTEYLSPANWGRPLYGDDASSPGWDDETTVRLFEVVEVLNRVDGVHYVSSLTINGVAGDLAMSGIAPLPNVVDPSTDLVVTVTMP